MKESYINPELIDKEKQRLEEETGRSDTFVLQLLIDVYGSEDVANYLKWYARKPREESQSRS